MAFAIRDHLLANWQKTLGAGAPQLIDVKVQETKRNSVTLALIN
jgi:hypothetical protein